jgi:hypothetical protein
MSNNQWVEKRKSKRRDILDKFSFYVCIPKLGYTRHKVNDISEVGIGVDIETLGEFRLNQSEICDLQFYLNQSLYLALKIEVVRTRELDTVQQVGATFKEIDSNSVATFKTLVQLVDQLSEFGEFLDQP